MTRRFGFVAVPAALTLVLASCGVGGLNFVKDDRLSITAPRDRATVTLPVTVRWDIERFDGTFAVFVDRAPLPSGKTLRWLARDDELCATTPGCPDDLWFSNRNIYRTSDTTLTLTELPELDRAEQREFHEVTIVLLGRDGRRVGESAFAVEFEINKGKGSVG